MTIKHIAARLFVLPRKRRRRENIYLTLWLLILGITFTSLFALTSQPAHAQTLTTTQQTKARHSTSYAVPEQPKDCDPNADDATFAACLAGTQPPNTGKVKNPLGDNPLMFFTDPSLTVGQSAVVSLWKVGVGVVDACIVILFGLSGIRIMVSGSIFRYADAVETIPRILVSLIAAHISLSLIGIMLGLNNTLSTAFLDFARNIDPSKDMPGVSFGNIFSDAIKTVVGSAAAGGIAGGLLSIGAGLLKTFAGPLGGAIGGVLDGISKSGAAKIGFGVAFAVTLLTQLPRIMLQIVALIMTTMLFAQMIVRLLLIDFYIVIAAPCIAASGLPGRSGQPVTNFWLKGIITTILAQALQVVGVILAGLLFDGIFHLLDGKLPGFVNNKVNDVNLTQLVVYIAMLWFIMRLPTLFSLNPSTQMIAAGGQLAASAASGVASAIGSGAATVVSVGGGAIVAARGARGRG